MRTIRHAIFAGALSLVLLGPVSRQARADHFYHPRSVVRVNPGASFHYPTPVLSTGFVVQPYSYRPSAFGLYSGQGLSSIQTFTGYRYLPVVTPGTSFRTGLSYGYPLRTNYLTPRTTVIPTAGLLPTSGVSPVMYTPTRALRTRPAFRPVSSEKQHIPGVRNYRPGVQLLPPK